MTRLSRVEGKPRSIARGTELCLLATLSPGIHSSRASQSATESPLLMSG